MNKRILSYMLTCLIALIICGFNPQLNAQTSATDQSEDFEEKVETLRPGTTTFLMRGYAHAGFQVVDEEASFVTGTFAPIFLWRHSDNILFESEAEIAYSDEGANFALEYANISYILSDYFIIRFGNFLTPFGIFGERLHPNWINRFPTNPLGFDHHSPVGPFAEVGVELRGAAPFGESSINYAFYLSNGPKLMVDSSTDPLQVSTSYSNYHDNNDNKAVGGRLGILPLSNNSLELGFSGQYANLGDRDTGYEEIGSVMLSGDFTFVRNSLSFLKGSIDLKGQWNYVNEDKFSVTDINGNTTTVNNDISAYFLMLSYRPNLASNNFMSNLELAVRYSSLNIINEDQYVSGGDGHTDHTHKTARAFPGLQNPQMSGMIVPGHGSTPLDTDKTQLDIGLNYWINWRSLLKCSFQILENDESRNAFFIHYALGF